MRVLLVRAGALGDVLLLRRTIASLQRAGHEAALMAPACGAVLVGPGAGAVARHLPWDGAEMATLLGGGAAAAGPLREALARFDAALVYTRSEEVREALARIVPRVVAHDPAPGGGHASEWLARPLAELGVADGGAPPSLAATPEEAAAAAALCAGLPPGFLAVHPGSGSPRKNWPARRFASLAAALVPAGAAWALVDGPADAAATAALRGAPGALPLSPALPLRVLAALLARAALYVGNDSGLSQLAAAWGARSLVLFGPTDPRTWRPVGPEVEVLRAEGGSMEALAVASVVDAARRCLRRR